MVISNVPYVFFSRNVRAGKNNEFLLNPYFFETGMLKLNVTAKKIHYFDPGFIYLEPRTFFSHNHRYPKKWLNPYLYFNIFKQSHLTHS